MNQPRHMIVVQVERVVYRKDDSGWSILATKPQASDCGTAADQVGQRLTCKGVVNFTTKEGDRLKLEGKFQPSTFNGDIEFVFTSAIPHLPTDMIALLHYAVSLTKGLGEQRESYIWSKYGEGWINQERLDISGLPEKVQENWRMTIGLLRERAGQAQAIAFLVSKGCTLNLASKAWDEWKDSTVGIVSDDCYQLATLPYCGFKKVDQDIRHNFGITDDDTRRLDAAIVYIMAEMTQRGSTLLDIWQVKEQVLALVPLDDEAFDQGIDRVRSGGRVVTLEGGKISTTADVQAESAIWKRFNTKPQRRVLASAWRC